MRPPASARPRRAAGAAAVTMPGDAGVRRQRPGPAAPAPGQPALAASRRSARRRGPARRWRPLLREAGVADGAVEVVFTGADHGIERGVEQDYQRACRWPLALRDDVAAGLRDERRAAAAAARLPAAPGGARAGTAWPREVAAADRRVADTPFDGFQMRAYRLRQQPGRRPARPLTRIAPRALIVPPGLPGLHVPDPGAARRPARARGPGLVRARPGHRGRGDASTAARTWAPAQLDAAGRARGPGAGGRLPWDVRDRRAGTSSARGPRTRPAGPSRTNSAAPWNRGGFANTALHRIDVVVPG